VFIGDAQTDEVFELFAADIGIGAGTGGGLTGGGVTAGGTTTGGTSGSGVVIDPIAGLPFGDYTQDGQGDVVALVDGQLVLTSPDGPLVPLDIPVPDEPIVGFNRVFAAGTNLLTNLTFYIVSAKGPNIDSQRVAAGNGFGLSNFVVTGGPSARVRGKVAASGDFNGDGIIDVAIPRGNRLTALVSNSGGDWDELTLVGAFSKGTYGRVLGAFVQASKTVCIGTKDAAEIGPGLDDDDDDRLTTGVVGVRPASGTGVPRCGKKTVAITTKEGRIVCVTKRRKKVVVDGEEVTVGLPVGPR
jgi:hypothetical protein